MNPLNVRSFITYLTFAVVATALSACGNIDITKLVSASSSAQKAVIPTSIINLAGTARAGAPQLLETQILLARAPVGTTTLVYRFDGAGVWQSATAAGSTWKILLPSKQVDAIVWPTRSTHSVTIRSYAGSELIEEKGPYAFRKGLSRDFNMDGFPDLAIAAPTSSIFGSQKGAVHIYLGAISGISTSSLAPWSVGNSAGSANANLGFTISSGDLNGDGYTDLVISAANENSGAGVIYVYYGTSHGLNVDSNRQLGTPDLTIQYPNPSYGYFMGVVSGDTNADGYDDIVAGAKFASTNFRGEAFVYYGSASGIHQTSAGLNNSADATLAFPGSSDWSGFGTTVGAGDFNHDGYMDLAIGATGDSTDCSGCGTVWLYAGGASGISPTPTTRLKMPNPTTESNANAAIFTVGDFDGDGFDDLASSAFQASVGSVSQAGLVSIYKGSSTIFSTSAKDADLVLNYPGTTGANFGRAVASGDFNGDGYDDLAVEATNSELASSNAAIFVYNGSSSGFHQDSVGVSNTANFMIASPGVAQGNYFGLPMAAADFTGSGSAMLVSGSRSDGHSYFYKATAAGFVTDGTSYGLSPWLILADPFGDAGSSFGASLMGYPHY